MRSSAAVVSFLLLLLSASVAAAGTNAGGVIVVHATDITYTTDNTDYAGQSWIWCGQDGPPDGTVLCPPYDPWEGADPCVVTAANPTSTRPAGVAQVWYVLAAFPPESCPHLKSTAFRIDYTESRLAVVASGYDEENVFMLELEDPEDGSPWPSPGSEGAWAWSSPLAWQSTSRLRELCWFAGYAYAGSGDCIFEVIPASNPSNRVFCNYWDPIVCDPIQGYGTLGFLGTPGHNPAPVRTYACCFGLACQVHLPADCAALGGDVLADYYCDPNPCLGTWGACCGPGGDCTFTLENDCDTGIFLPHEPCVPYPGPAACCFADGSCLLLLWEICHQDGGEWLLEQSSCDPNPCPIPSPTERTSWGRIKSRYRE